MNILDGSALKMKNELPYFEIPEIVSTGWICHAYLTRKGGVSLPPYQSLNLSGESTDLKSHVIQNRRRVAETFRFDEKTLVLLHQSHQDQILVLKAPGLPPSPLNYDAAITNLPDSFLGILTADCIPIFVVDLRKKVIAAIHAGRQGTALRIVPKVLNKMEAEFGCLKKDFLISLGPSIGFCCYEIDERVFLQEWEPYSTPMENGKKMLDLGRINMGLIAKEGISEDQIFWIDHCTHCHPDLFFSYRKEGRTGRQLSFIGITDKI